MLLNIRLHPLSDLGAASESYSKCASSCPLRQERFLGVLCLSARSAMSAPLCAHGLPPRAAPPPGFDYPPGGLRRTPHSPVCFAGTALQGFCPPEVSPPADPIRFSTDRCPPDIPRPGNATEAAPSGRCCLLGFHPGKDALPPTRTVRCDPRPLLPWAFPSPGTSSVHAGRALARPPLSSFAAATLPTLPLLTRVFAMNGLAYPSRDRRPPRGSCTSSPPRAYPKEIGRAHV